MPGRAIKNHFTQLISEDEAPEPEECDACLKNCSADYCILDALKNARDGLVDDAVVFAGKNVYKIKDILPVSQIFEQMLAEFAAAE